MKEFFKNLGRYKVSSTLNILGLGIAFAAAYAILVQVNYDLSYNRSLKDAERVFRFESSALSKVYDGKMFAGINDAMGQSFGEDTTMVESFGRMHYSQSPLKIKLSDGEDGLVEIKESWGTTGAPETMGFRLVSGSFDRLSTPNSILLSEKFAKAHNIELDGVIQDANNRSLTVVGIFEDFPRSCDLYGLQMFMAAPLRTWDGNWQFTYFYKLKEAWMKDAFLESLYPKFKSIYGEKYESMSLEEFRSNPLCQLQLTALKDIHFSETVSETKTADATTTYTLLAIGIVIIIIAFVNFINFFMAMIPRRIRRVNTEKIFGCTIRRLRLGFVGEAIGMVVLGLLLAFLIIFYIAPEVSANQFISTSIALEDNWDVVLVMLGAGVVLAVVASVYPAYYITSIPPSFAIKGSFGNTVVGRRLRFTLLGLQYLIAITLITCTLFIKQQHSYMMSYNIGVDKKHLLAVELGPKAAALTTKANRPALMSLLNESPMIKDVAFSYQNIVSDGWRTSNDYEVIGEDRKIRMDLQEVTPNFLEVMGIGITEGRNFESHDIQNPQGAVIYPEFAKRKYNLTMDTRVNYDWRAEGDTKLVGFCEDVKMQPLQKATRPTAFYVSGRDPRFFTAYIRTTENVDLDVLKAHIESSFAKLDPQVKPEQLKIQSIDEQLSHEYEQELELTRLISVFSIVAILIALMGVFGLVFFETQYRRREIALRRVHGAQISEILRMFVMQYARMVLVAFLFAVPVSYLIMSRWLEGYAYHIPLYWWVFALALLIVLAVTSAIVLARSWKAARENPVNALYKE